MNHVPQNINIWKKEIKAIVVTDETNFAKYLNVKTKREDETAMKKSRQVIRNCSFY